MCGEHGTARDECLRHDLPPVRSQMQVEEHYQTIDVLWFGSHDCHHRARRVPETAASPVPRGPPVDREPVLRLFLPQAEARVDESAFGARRTGCPLR
jgi:hypothetical protein